MSRESELTIGFEACRPPKQSLDGAPSRVA